MPDEKSKISKWAPMATPILIGVIGGIFTYYFNIQQEKNRDAQLGLQIMSQREQYEITFRQRMFEPLVEQILNSEVPVEKRVSILKLFVHNFHDVFNSRALFDVLEEASMKAGRPDLIEKLVSMAKDVSEEQKRLIGATPDLHLMEEEDIIELELGMERDDHGRVNENEGKHGVTVKLMKIFEYAVRVEVVIHPEEPDDEEEHFDFKVSFFDAPLTDNVLLADGHRFAITLKETDIINHPHTAKLSVFEFPANYVTTGYRPSITKAAEMFEGNN